MSSPEDTTISTHDPSSHDHKHLTKLIIGAIGVVYGDIGTSPLYAFKESFWGRT